MSDRLHQAAPGEAAPEATVRPAQTTEAASVASPVPPPAEAAEAAPAVPPAASLSREESVASGAAGTTPAPAEEAAEEEPVEHTVNPEVKPKAPLLKRVSAWMGTYVLPPRARRAFRVAVGVALPLLCLLQLVLWGLKLPERFTLYFDALHSLDPVAIAIVALEVFFAVTLLVQAIYGLVTLARRSHRVHLGTVTTLYAFFVVMLALAHLFPAYAALLEIFTFRPILPAAFAITGLFALLRLTDGDRSLRWCSMLFSLLSLAAVLMLFWQGAGNFASVELPGMEPIPFGSLDLGTYVGGLFQEEVAPWSIFYDVTDNMDLEPLLRGLQAVCVFVTNLLPYAALSLVGYLIHGVAGYSHEQHLNLRVALKVTVTLIVACALSLGAAAAQLVLGMLLNDVGYTVTLSPTDIAVTLALLILLAVLTAMPYRVYRMVYNRRFAAYRKLREENP